MFIINFFDRDLLDTLPLTVDILNLTSKIAGSKRFMNVKSRKY